MGLSALAAPRVDSVSPGVAAISGRDSAGMFKWSRPTALSHTPKPSMRNPFTGDSLARFDRKTKARIMKARYSGGPKLKATAPNIAKFFLTNFSDVQFFLGPSFNSESMVFSIYPDGAVTPNFYYIMGGFVAEKF